MESKGVGQIFGPGKEYDAHAAEMHKKLGNPQLRKQLRVETRAQVESLNPELAQVLGLAANEGAALIDLLTDQQMQHLDVFFAALSVPQTADAANALMQQRSNEETRNYLQIEELIGAERFERYLDYTGTVMERRYVVHFDDQLDAADKLTADRKQRLMTIVRTEIEQSMQRRRGAMSSILPRTFSGAREDIETMMRKQRLESTENSFRQMQEDSKLLLARLPDVLTPSQLAVYARMENDKLARQRKHVQQMRVDAGLTPEFNEGPPTARPEGRTPVVGPVRIEVFIRTNDGEPVNVDFIAENGKAAAPFAASDSLWVEATPLLFADGWAHIDYQFFEERNGERRPIRGALGSDMPTRMAPVPLGIGGAGTTVNGRKAYAIRVDARISPMQ